MSDKPPRSVLVDRIAELDEEGALAEVRRRVAAGEDPLRIVDDCQRGMRFVGEHYQSGRYFISGLIMAGEIFGEAVDTVAPLLPDTISQGTSGKVVLCTVQGDIHDLGKNIVAMLLRSYGFTVHDLGVDVPPTEVVRRTHELAPDIVGLSALLTGAGPAMKETVRQLRLAERKAGRATPIIIGGGQADEQFCKAIGADLWARDAVRGVGLMRQAVATGGD
jgi:methylmalonyl-CoA mutase cobalamin-binding domain/chain